MAQTMPIPWITASNNPPPKEGEPNRSPLFCCGVYMRKCQVLSGFYHLFSVKKSGKSLPRWRLRVYVETSTFFNRRPPSTTVQIRRIRPVSGCPVYMQKCHHLSTSWGLVASLAGYFLRGSSVVQSGFSRASLELNRVKILSLRSCFVAKFSGQP